MKRTGVYCDRCGKEFKYAQTKWAGILRGLKPKSVKLTKLFYIGTEVTAWMPLPEPYKDEKGQRQ